MERQGEAVKRPVIKYLFSFLFLFNLCIAYHSTASAQDDFFEAEVDNVDQDLDFGGSDDLTDDDEIDFETDDFVESGDSEPEQDKDQAQNQEEEDSDLKNNSAEQEISETADDLEKTFNEADETPINKGELSFQPASSYGTFNKKKYDWSAFVHFGYQYANVSTEFYQSTALVNLPNEYTDIGVDIIKTVLNKPYVYGGKIQILTESVTTATYNAEYKVNLLTPFVGYKFIDDIVTITGTLGLVIPVTASSTLTALSDSSSSDKDFSIGLSYTAGVISVVSLKQFLLGFDGGLLFLQGQKLDGEQLQAEQGGYLRILLGLAF